MINVNVPGDRQYQFDSLVLDYNGTIAEGGKVISEIGKQLEILSGKLKIYVLTADTYGSVREELQNFPVEIEVISKDDETLAKGNFVQDLKKTGMDVIAIGNGANDQEMLRNADVGIAMLGKEGLYAGNVNSAKILSASIVDALQLILNVNALIATLRK